MQADLEWDRQPGPPLAGDIDLAGLGRALWDKRLLIGGLTLVAAVLAFTGVNLVTPRYKSEARVLIEMRENIFFRPDAEKTFERSATVDQEAVTSQVQLILSRDLAREVIKSQKLSERPEFDPVLAGWGLPRTILSLLGIIKNPLDMTPEERVLKSYYERLSAFQVEKSRVIAIEFESQDPELAARVANAVAETYLRFQQAAKQDQTRAASAWLSGEIERLRKNVAQAEAKVEQYRAKTNLFIGNNNTSLSNQQLGDFNGQLASARAQKADAQSKASLIRDALKSGSPIEFADIINSELMRRLSEQRITLRAQLAEQSSTLLGMHPRIKELRAQIADLERQMRDEADRLARSLENDARVASSKVDALTSTLDQLKRQAASTNEQDVQLRALERDAKSQRDLLESYLAKYREASARDSIGAAAPDARIISTAAVSTTPSWPKKLPIILVAALATFTLASISIVSGELLRAAPLPGRMGTPSPPAVLLPPATIAVSRPADLVLGGGGAARSRISRKEGIERLARQLDEAGQGAKDASREGARRITVIGISRNIGTSMTAIALARNFATQTRVVLVELSVAAPNLSVIASDPGSPGLSELVLGSASFGQIITRDRHSRAHLVLIGRAAIDAASLMASERLAIAVEALARSYDHLVLDAGVAEDVSLERLAALAPCAVLVAADHDGAATADVRERLLSAGFGEVSVFVDMLTEPQSESGTQAAA
jgi:succinoglycan biosynthesis transport protein ExoP